LNVKKLFLVFVLLGLIGCQPWETGKPIAPDKVSEIQKGKTTQVQIIQMFGTPTEAKVLYDEEIEYTYRHCLKNSKMPGSAQSDSTEPESCDELSILFNKSQTVKDLKYAKKIPGGRK
jgi:outer membrane protein assembly factor BamE (lipoprotein component of BamABCDE complex)